MKKSLSIAFLIFVSVFVISCNRKKVHDQLVVVDGGQFVMGDDKIALPWGYYSHAEHVVTLSSFLVAPYEVTQHEFEEIMGYNPSFYQGSSKNRQVASSEEQVLRPVDKVNWYEAIVFCNKLSVENGLKPAYLKEINIEDYENLDKILDNEGKKALANGEPVWSRDVNLWGKIPANKGFEDWDSISWDKKANGYRLLTEAEWEYVAKGGNLSKNYTSSGFNFSDSDVKKYCWSKKNSNKVTHQVGILSPNELGVFDMAGNLQEWCWDWFDEKYYYTPEANDKNPSGPESGEDRCVRGSCWDDEDEDLAVIIRGSSSPYITGRRTGFRICRNIR